MKLINFIFYVLIFMQIASVTAQEITNEQTIKYINEKLNKSCVLEAKSNQLIFQFYKNGEIYRQDKANVHGLDFEKVTYKPDENAIIIYCVEPDDECIMRWVYKNNIKKPFTRLNILVENIDEKSINGIVKALSHLIKTYNVPDYKLYEFFE